MHISVITAVQAFISTVAYCSLPTLAELHNIDRTATGSRPNDIANGKIVRGARQTALGTFTNETHKDTQWRMQMAEFNLSDLLVRRKRAAQRIAAGATTLYDEFLMSKMDNNTIRYKNIAEMPSSLFWKFNVETNETVADCNRSYVVLPDRLPNDSEPIIEAIQYSAGLDETAFRPNSLADKSIGWQYFSTNTGPLRLYSGRECPKNVTEYKRAADPRLLSWYNSVASGPKDVVIIIDCSFSMNDENFSVAKSVAATVIEALTSRDYFNVICARKGDRTTRNSGDAVSEVSGCNNASLVPATTANKAGIVETVNRLQATGNSDLRSGFQAAFDLLKPSRRTQCQSIIIFVSNGKHSSETEGQSSETAVRNLVDSQNKLIKPKARIFSFLIGADSNWALHESLSCSSGGAVVSLTTTDDLINQMQPYFVYLSQRTVEWAGLWTPPERKPWNRRVAITYAVAAVSKMTMRTLGFAAVDVTLTEIEELLNRYKWAPGYIFVIDRKGKTIIHPQLPKNMPALQGSVNIKAFEQNGTGDPEFFGAVEQAMRRGEKGYKTLLTKNMTYYYAPASEEYSFAFVVTPSHTPDQSSGSANKVMRKQLGELSNVGEELCNSDPHDEGEDHCPVMRDDALIQIPCGGL